VDEVASRQCVRRRRDRDNVPVDVLQGRDAVQDVRPPYHVVRCRLPPSSLPVVVPNGRRKQQLRRRLLDWYARHARDLPWRRTRDPYAIWVSEIMLQQTQVGAVIPHYQRFLSAFPTVEALADATQEDVLRLWEGLGYYRRAQQLHRSAAVIVSEHGGHFPRDLATARSLPGIGRYTAGAILSIAFDQPLPILEANTIRLWSRVTGYRGDPRTASGQQFLWDCAAVLVPPQQAGAFNQAAMEVGSEICPSRSPCCDRCPVAELCTARRESSQQEIPARARKPRYQELHEVAFVVCRRGRVLVRRCLPHERWAGLWDFPRLTVPAETCRDPQPSLMDRLRECTGIRGTITDQVATMRYGVTRFRITLACYRVRALEGHLNADHLRWIVPQELHRLPLSVTGRRISHCLVS